MFRYHYRYTKWVVLIGLALLLRVALLAWLYTPNLLRFDNGDYALYRIGAQEIAARGLDFSNSLFMVRPPLYPLMIALLGIQAPLVLAANLVLGLLLVPITYKLAQAFGLASRDAFLAAAAVAIDPASARYSTTLLAEPLANLLLGLAFTVLLKALRTSLPLRGLSLGMLAGLLVAGAALARPAAFLLWLPTGLIVLGLRRQAARQALAFMGTAALICASWMLHNAVFFDNFNFSTIGVYNLLYYRAASVERLASGDDISVVYARLSQQVEARLGRETDTVDENTRHRHYATNAQTQSAMLRVALDIFLEHPQAYMLTIPVGLYRTLLVTENLPALLRPLDLLWNAAFLLFTALGLWTFWQRGQRLAFWLILLICLYFMAGTLAIQTSGIDTRARSMLAPFMACAALAGLRAVYAWRARRTSHSTPA